jgi:hypothetical protein
MEKIAIVIVGNGFDLAHGLSTSYTNFIEHHENDDELNNTFWFIHFKKMKEKGRWMDLENEFKKILDLLDEIFIAYPSLSKADVLPSKYDYLLKFLNPNQPWYEMNVYTEYAHDGKKTLKKPERNVRHTFIHDFFVSDNYWNYDTIRSRLNFEMDLLKRKLKFYINENSELSDEKLLCNIKEKLENYKDVYAINFNYNTNFKKYYSHAVMFNVHGNVDQEIVLGHNSINSPEFAKYNKQSQRIINNLKNYDIGENLIHQHDIDIIVLGHSLDQNDHEVIIECLDELFNSPIREAQLYGSIVADYNNSLVKHQFKIFKYNDDQLISTVFNLSILSKKISILLSSDTKDDIFDFAQKNNFVEFVEYK